AEGRGDAPRSPGLPVQRVHFLSASVSQDYRGTVWAKSDGQACHETGLTDTTEACNSFYPAITNADAHDRGVFPPLLVIKKLSIVGPVHHASIAATKFGPFLGLKIK